MGLSQKQKCERYIQAVLMDLKTNIQYMLDNRNKDHSSIPEKTQNLFKKIDLVQRIFNVFGNGNTGGQEHSYSSCFQFGEYAPSLHTVTFPMYLTQDEQQKLSILGRALQFTFSSLISSVRDIVKTTIEDLYGGQSFVTLKFCLHVVDTTTYNDFTDFVKLFFQDFTTSQLENVKKNMTTCKTKNTKDEMICKNISTIISSYEEAVLPQSRQQRDQHPTGAQRQRRRSSSFSLLPRGSIDQSQSHMGSVTGRLSRADIRQMTIHQVHLYQLLEKRDFRGYLVEYLVPHYFQPHEREFQDFRRVLHEIKKYMLKNQSPTLAQRARSWFSRVAERVFSPVGRLSQTLLSQMITEGIIQMIQKDASLSDTKKTGLIKDIKTYTPDFFQSPQIKTYILTQLRKKQQQTQDMTTQRLKSVSKKLQQKKTPQERQQVQKKLVQLVHSLSPRQSG